jgi:serine/threonine protein kinase
MSKAEQIKIVSLGSGTYGCVTGKKDIVKNTIVENVTKIQKKEETSANETQIGKKIMAIRSYDEYFAPVLKTENINISQLNKEQIDNCEFIHNDKDGNTKYESNEIKYVGEFSLKKYLSKIITSSQEFLRILLSDHIVLLEAIEKLIDAGIVHYDLKENNVMMRTKDGRPIIIDFGLSIDTATSNEKSFYRYYPNYAPWCIDIVMLSFMVNEKGTDWQEQIITKEDITKVVNEYFKENYGVTDLLLPDEVMQWKSETQQYFNLFINRPWKDLYVELLKYRFTWDNYSLTVIYLFLFDQLSLNSYIEELPELKKYKELLKQSMMTIPSNRPLPTNMKTSINTLFKSINRKVLKNARQKIKVDYGQKEVIQDAEKKMAMSVLVDQKHEGVVYTR